MIKNKVVQIIILGMMVICFAACSPGDSASKQGTLNDTGITWGADYPRGVNDDCSAKINQDKLPSGSDKIEGDILSQQDCVRGRDVTANNHSDGAAGFVYRKIGRDGDELRAGAKDWACVLDEISGLLWEVKLPADKVYGNQGFHDGDDLFTWYDPNSDTNGGAIGDWNRYYNQCAGYTADQPGTYCNIEEFVSRVNKQGLCGFNDWRVPSLPELVSLVDFGSTSPTVDTAYFPNTQTGYYWSSSPDANLKATAWAIDFQFGASARMPRDNGHYVRLVRDWNPESQRNN